VKIVVIGSGFGGIASALRMKNQGHDVTLLEKLDEIGGRAQHFKRPNYFHDAGPTVITAPYLFSELFELFGEKLEDYLQFKPLDPWYRFYFVNGFEFDYLSDQEKMLKQIHSINPTDVDGYNKMLKKAQEIFKTGYLKLVDQPFHKLTTMIRYTPDILRLKGYQSVYRFVSTYLKDENLRQVFSIQPLLVGGNPFQTSSIYALIHALEQKWGIYFAIGGMSKVVRELKNLMIRQGIEIKTNHEVEKFETSMNRISKIIIKDKPPISADIVISNADPITVNNEFLNEQKISLHNRFIKKYAKHSMGLFVLFFGTKIKYPKIAHHTIWMGLRYKELLDEIFNKQILSDDFSIYLHRPTATDESFANKGSDSFYALVPVPNLQAKLPWEDIKMQYANKIIKALANTIMPNLENVIDDLFIMTPENFKESYMTPHGSGFSIAPTLSQTAWFRTHNKDDYYNNLYYVGAGTHPGAGVPGVLNSAKVVERIIHG
jgi:phytoene desaturase